MGQGASVGPSVLPLGMLFAETLSTYLGAWAYPGQAGGWEAVSQTITSRHQELIFWTFVIVADLKHARSAS